MSQNIFEEFGTTRDEVASIVDERHLHYISYPIRKHSGKKPRFIDAPSGRLKELQDAFLHNVLYKFRTSSIAHGFVAGRDPKTNAACHLGAITVIKTDLKDFFGSVKESMVFNMLTLLCSRRYEKLPEIPTAEDYALLAKLLTYKGRVPQGAPTSPAVTNLYVLGMDGDLKKLAQEYDLTVTRYADDITFSTCMLKLNAITKTAIIRKTKNICSKFGLRLNHRKTRIRSSASRIAVTGVVVNQKLNVAKDKYRVLRARVHNFSVGTLQLDEKELQSLRGQIEWLRSINPAKAEPLLRKLGCKISKPSCRHKETIPA